MGNNSRMLCCAVFQDAVHVRIAESIAYQGPIITLNTLVGALVIGVGTLSGQ